MEPWSRVRVAKCQMLLLGLSVATTAALTYFGAHFAVIYHASSERTPPEATHLGAFYVSITLAGLLTLGAMLSATATVREATGLMAAGFLCFALVFCVLVQVAFWRFHNPTQMEDAVLDVYDLVYDQAVRSSPGVRQQELAAIQDTFLCCGKPAPSSLPGNTVDTLCQGEVAERQDCLQSIRSLLRTHGSITSTLTGLGLASTVYAMLLSSFLWFAIRSGCSLDRRGTYTLSPRAHDCQPQEPSVFRRCQAGPAPHHPVESDVPHRSLGSSRRPGGPRLLQDSRHSVSATRPPSEAKLAGPAVSSLRPPAFLPMRAPTLQSTGGTWHLPSVPAFSLTSPPAAQRTLPSEAHVASGGPGPPRLRASLPALAVMFCSGGSGTKGGPWACILETLPQLLLLDSKPSLMTLLTAPEGLHPLVKIQSPGWSND
ncbi:tetraspanin-32 isoform X2 [Manis pentadactyla]|uniref:tetraspanin-32 isoform X2 n=1 Tax=Manis pentadactyla TaxID=143292 RepID=UPI00255CD10F|nr:tetraspanin-32 isoform X2 [Manis pentadactyla]